MPARFSHVRVSLSDGLNCLDHAFGSTLARQLRTGLHDDYLDTLPHRDPPALMLHRDRVSAFQARDDGSAHSLPGRSMFEVLVGLMRILGLVNSTVVGIPNSHVGLPPCGVWVRPFIRPRQRRLDSRAAADDLP